VPFALPAGDGDGCDGAVFVLGGFDGCFLAGVWKKPVKPGGLADGSLVSAFVAGARCWSRCRLMSASATSFEQMGHSTIL
jgi:hypothetical protein